MKVLIAASECSPLVKIGGIADVIGSLPIVLKQLGIDVRVVIPLYKPIWEKIQNKAISATEILQTNIHFGDKNRKVIVYETKLPQTDITVYLIHNEDYISYDGIYFSPRTMTSPEDEVIRFAFFSKAISAIFTYADSIFHPDILHCHDWHTGLVPQIIQSTHRYTSVGLPKTIFTIHNLGYQGFSKLDVADKLDININSDQSLRWDAQDDNLDFLLQGIIGADFVTTVSEKYSREIQTPEYGEGLHEILRARTGRLTGILNGISYEIFNPLTDKLIYNNYSVGNWRTEKIKNKIKLQQETELETNPNKPILGIISRLVHQKGINLVADSINQIAAIGYQIVILGTGDPQLEASLKDHDKNGQLKGAYSANIKFSKELAMKIYAGADMFLIPSRYEPCGLTQMIAMKYGTVPIVRATGGLEDTVTDKETGFVFEKFDKSAMLEKIKEAFIIYINNKDDWGRIITNCMNQDFSWKENAKKYALLYQRAMSL